MALADFSCRARPLSGSLPFGKILLSTFLCHRMRSMEIRRRDQTITRYHPPGITPLELWDLWIGERILWDTMQEPTFPELLREVLVQLRRGGGATRSEGRVPGSIAGFDTIFVAGGRSQELPIRSALASLDLPVHFSATPQNPGREAALRLLAQRNGA